MMTKSRLQSLRQTIEEIAKPVPQNYVFAPVLMERLNAAQPEMAAITTSQQSNRFVDTVRHLSLSLFLSLSLSLSLLPSHEHTHTNTHRYSHSSRTESSCPP